MNKIEQAVIYNKILGSLACAGMGDALGAATELYSIDEIKTQWGGFLNAFVFNCYIEEKQSPKAGSDLKMETVFYAAYVRMGKLYGIGSAEGGGVAAPHALLATAPISSSRMPPFAMAS